MDEFLASNVFLYVFLPILIFGARVIDVSLGTLRIIFVSRGKKWLAPLVGFFEVLIWIMVIGRIMNQSNNMVAYLAYAAGFATGNLVGITLENKLALGNYIVRIFLIKEDENMKSKIMQGGFGVTSVKGMGANGPVNILYSVIKRKDAKKICDIIEQCDAKAFYSIEEARAVHLGVFPGPSQDMSPKKTGVFRAFLKRK